MRGLKRTGMALLAVSLLASLGAMTAMAASRTKITTIRLEFKDNIVRGEGLDEEQVQFATSADEYAITGWEFENESLVWSDTDVPRVTVQLDTADDYYFSVSKDKVKVKGDMATVYSTKREESQTLFITFDLLPIAQRVGQIEYAYLKDSIASWSPALGATSYELLLLRDSSVVGSKKVTTETSYDFGTSMLKDGAYYYRVRGVGADSKKVGLYLDSEEYYKTQGGTASSSGGNQKANNSNAETGAAETGAAGTDVWIQDETGWWWQRADGTWPVSQMDQIGGKWYLFNEKGYMVTGWVTLSSQWYYFGPEGDRWVSCQTPDGYTLDANGVRQ